MFLTQRSFAEFIDVSLKTIESRESTKNKIKEIKIIKDIIPKSINKQTILEAIEMVSNSSRKYKIADKLESLGYNVDKNIV